MFYLLQLESFLTKRDSYFDITTADVLESIRKDTNKTQANKDEDIEFVTRLKNNQRVRFGGKDKDFNKRQKIKIQKKCTTSKPDSAENTVIKKVLLLFFGLM